MANYKIVDSDQLDADLSLVAGAIRNKSGTSDNLVFPTGFVSAVNAISSNGGNNGLPIGITALASGTHTCATDPLGVLKIRHGLDVTPNFFVIFAEGQLLDYSDFYYYTSLQFGLAQAYTDSSPQSYFKVLRYGDPTTFRQMTNYGSSLSDFADDEGFFVYNSTTYGLKAGVTYRWFAGVVEGI